MSYLVAHMQKMKAGNLVGLGNHIDRKTDFHSNPDIDPARSGLNFDLVDRDKNLQKDVTDYIEKNKSDKKITRKDAVLVNSWVISSDQNFFKELEQEQQKKFFEEAKNFFAERFGETNIRYATVHLDETTPHMHLGVVPFDSNNHLAAKRVFDRKTLEEIQADLPRFLHQKGFDIERGQKNSERVHLDTPEYKATMKELEEVKKELRLAKKECHALATDRHLLADKVRSLQKGLDSHKLVQSISDYKTVPLTTNVMVPREDLQKLLKSEEARTVLKQSVKAFEQALGSDGGSYGKVKEVVQQAEEEAAKARQLMIQAEKGAALYQEQLTLNQRFAMLSQRHQETEKKLKEALASKDGLEDLVEALRDDKEQAYTILAETVKGMNLLVYDDGDYKADLSKPQKALLEKLTLMAERVTELEGFNALSQGIKKEYGFSETFLEFLEKVLPSPIKKISRGFDLEL